jgi:pyruvate kinase
MGPAVNNPESVRKLIRAGMNVARLNFSHGTHEQHAAMIAMLKEARAEAGVPLAIMLDTKGPEIRVASSWKEREFKAGDRIRLGFSAGQIPVRPASVLEYLRPQMRVLFDDGYLVATVTDAQEQSVEVEFLNDGVLKPNKSMNLPGTRIPLPALTPQDEEDLRFGVEHGVDLVAASFVRSAEHVVTIRALITRLGAPALQIIAKIENAEGIQNFDEIVQVADGIMVARGDLGVEMPIAQVPRLQKMMIRKCFFAGKPVVTATQMLESMISHPRPTRAEVSDVANAIYDSTSAVMLSGETAMGQYPIEAVETMRAVIEETERDVNFRELSISIAQHSEHELPSAVAQAAVRTAHASGAEAIFAFTKTGSTVRLLSRLRPARPILAFVPDPQRYHQMALLWGVMPFLSGPDKELGSAFEAATKQALEKHAVREGDLVVVTAGAPFGIAGTTNSMIVETIGKIWLRGRGCGAVVSGVLVPWSAGIHLDLDSILWVEDWSAALAEEAQRASGVLYTNPVPDPHKERTWLDWGQKHHKSVLVRTGGSVPALPQEGPILLDPKRGILMPVSEPA